VFQFNWDNLKDFGYGFAAKRCFDAENTLRKHIKDLGHGVSPWCFFYEKLHSQWMREELADLISENSKIIEKCNEKITELLGYVETFLKGG